MKYKGVLFARDGSKYEGGAQRSDIIAPYLAML
jgi:hypothetical protein